MQSISRGEAAESNILSHLRQATNRYHRALEEQLRLEGSITREHYARVLQGFHSFLSAWEPLVASALPASMRTWAAQGRTAAVVEQDLRALGVDVPAPAVLQLNLATRAAAMGSLYVLEGSAVGAQVIGPRLSEELGLHAGNGAAFFASGPGAAQRWRDFRFLLEHGVVSQTAREQACAAAVSTFTALSRTFQSFVHEPAVA
jgi:heme oxygenase